MAGLEERPSLSIILPAYNEEKNIERAVLQAVETMDRLGLGYEIIVVDDGSNDNTERIASLLSRDHSEITLVRHEKNRGYGAALKSGIRASKGELIFFTDSDLQFDMGEVADLLEWTGDYHIIAGYRRRRNDPPGRRFNSFVWRVLIHTLFGLNVRDINCAFKIFRREVFNRIPISSIGAFVNTEIFLKAKRCGFLIKEVPVSHYPRRAGEPTGAKPGVIVKAILELMKLYREVK